jgi:hypothetical protein
VIACFFQRRKWGNVWCDRVCEDIPRWKSLCCDSSFAHKKEYSVFKFPKRFLEFSWAKRSLYSLYLLYSL